MTVEKGPASPEREPRPRRGRFAVHVLPALLWALAIFVGGGSGMPQPRIDAGFPVPFDKLEHFVAFLVLQVLSFRALRYEWPERERRQLLWLGALVAVLVGIALELYQLGLPDRSAEVADVAADGVGAAFGAFVFGFTRWP